jgi:Phage tail assembly chaperone proteins, E, or 41 or 14
MSTPDLKIDLLKPINTPNGVVGTITLTREPKCLDLRNAQRKCADENDQIWHMVCALSAEKLVDEDINELSLADVQQVMGRFRQLAGL